MQEPLLSLTHRAARGSGRRLCWRCFSGRRVLSCLPPHHLESKKKVTNNNNRGRFSDPAELGEVAAEVVGLSAESAAAVPWSAGGAASLSPPAAGPASAALAAALLSVGVAAAAAAADAVAGLALPSAAPLLASAAAASAAASPASPSLSPSLSAAAARAAASRALCASPECGCCGGDGGGEGLMVGAGVI